jgi:ABC-type glycerol-3-phosphate transport system substrate-binding protein
MTETKPTQLPLEEAAIMTETAAQPKDLSAEEIAMMTEASFASAEPSAEPPQSSQGQADDGGVTAWQNSKKFTALWTINQNRNAWVYVSGIGWKKLADNSDSAKEALNLLASHAKQLARTVNYRDEADGKIHEIYVW